MGMANPNIPNIAGVCPLHYAVERRDAAAVGRLTRYGANMNVADNSKWFTPLHVVCHRHPQIGNIDDLGTTDLDRASRSCITRLLCDVQEPVPADPNSEDWEGNTPLHYVVTLTDDDVANVLSILLEKGGNPNAVNKRGQTPLHLLSHNEALREMDVFQEMLHDMLFHGADPNFGSKSGCTALHLSLYHRDVDSAVQLMSSGAKLDLVWNKPKNWVAFWNDMGEDGVLPLDMVTDDHSLHRVLASISTLQIQMPSRGRCMQCKASLGTFSRVQHCHHCGRHLCLPCCNKLLGVDYFPKFCAVLQASSVCTACEQILLSRKDEETTDETQPTTPSSYGEGEYQ
jgi:ankyrin repeat protein